ncbi:energy-coupling factor ABC transporter ATP-binding protein [Desulforhopalus singaporensis]|uniref:Cobalt/nickel transport system ATP-binding protein n=1 Tax=Desulforhopalus singaporensis TaxID=91360 RepID=A0A1H0KTF0_9BACT|nr:ABC transporter ATP-binding protein [Desulforhopalus singaporensis]SDO59020.1 cobalt/nickel transport system ATP-binding protein [Desulforhopalus singaporensis]
MLQLREVSYTYPMAKEPILSNLSFTVEDKKAGIIGPNGCGKTTLLHMMVGLIKPDKGELLFHGRPVTTKQDLRTLRKEVGFLFQSSDDQLFSPTVLEDVAFGPLNLGFSPGEAREIAVRTLEDLGLSGFEERITHRLSGGEKKLVALATILAMRPRILLLDEPTNNLDPKTTSRLIEILQDLDLYQIIISHDWDFLSHTTSVLYMIDHGHIHRCQKDHIHVHRHVHAAGDHPHTHNL